MPLKILSRLLSPLIYLWEVSIRIVFWYKLIVPDPILEQRYLLGLGRIGRGGLSRSLVRGRMGSGRISLVKGVKCTVSISHD